MKNLFTLLLVAICATSFSQTLIWSDEFDGNSLDETKWNAITQGDGAGNNEAQYYLPKNVSVANGKLILTTLPEYYDGGDYARDYTSGKVTSQGKASFKYGRMEASIKMPSGLGMWPAFWMLGDERGWPQCGEIDIMEAKGRYPTMSSGALHYGYAWDNKDLKWGETNMGINLDEDFHTYAIEWTPTQIRLYNDDVNFFTNSDRISCTDATWCPFGEANSWNYYFILNAAIGGHFDNYSLPPGSWTGTTMEIDYVRVYSLPGYEPTVYDIAGKLEMEDYDMMSGLQTESCSDVGGGSNLGYVDAGDYADYRVDVTEAGTYDVEFRVATQNDDGQQFTISDENGILATINVPYTGDWQSWESVTVQIDLTAGEQILRIDMLDDSFNMNYMDFVLVNGQGTNETLEVLSSSSISLYPNPAENEVQLALSNKVNLPANLKIIDITGKNISNETITTNISHINTSKLESGIYFMEIATINGKITQKIVIK